MIPWRTFLLLLQYFSQWIRKYGEMISSDLHGVEIPQMDVVTLVKGKEMSETCTKEKEGLFTEDTLVYLDPGGSCSSTWTLALGGP
jgi:hypothetical protein